MSRLISDILQSPEPDFSHELQDWENMTGRTGRDLQLISDIAVARKQTLSKLGLDENDTTAKELFYALRHRAQDTNSHFEDFLDVDYTVTPEELMQKIITFINGLGIARDVWVVKHAAVKELLRAQPPKKLLRILGLRSVDSVLKRSNACELLSLAFEVESAEWTNRFQKKYKLFKPADFQAGKSNLYLVEAAKAKKLYAGGYERTKLIIPNYETATILLFPPHKRFPQDTLVLTLAILQALYDVRVYSAYFRFISVRPNFGPAFSKVMQAGLPGGLYENKIGWRVLQRHFSRQPQSFENIEQPHFQYDDVVLEHPLQTLHGVLPDMNFWVDIPHVFVDDESGRPVSFHLMDVLLNASNKIPYEDSRHHSLRGTLWEELALRYLQHETLEAAVITNMEQEDTAKQRART